MLLFFAIWKKKQTGNEAVWYFGIWAYLFGLAIYDLKVIPDHPPDKFAPGLIHGRGNQIINYNLLVRGSLYCLNVIDDLVGLEKFTMSEKTKEAEGKIKNSADALIGSSQSFIAEIEEGFVHNQVKIKQFHNA